MKQKEYRILEHQGLFYVQIKDIKETKIDFLDAFVRYSGPLIIFTFPYGLWLAYKHRNDIPEIKTEWYNINAFGGKPIYGYFSIPAIGGFKTIDKAKNYIQLLNTPDKIHYIND